MSEKQTIVSKRDIIKKIRWSDTGKNLHLKNSQIKYVIDSLLDEIVERTNAGDKVVFEGFGAFVRKLHVSRNYKMPDGEIIRSADMYKLTFTPSEIVEKRFNNK